jgi:VanZ family protein
VDNSRRGEYCRSAEPIVRPSGVRPDRRLPVGLVAAVLLVVLNAALLLSSPVATWWRDQRVRLIRFLPARYRDDWLALRSIGNADVHVLLWFGPALLVGLAVACAGRRTCALLVLLVVSVAIEIAQSLLPGREMEIGDVVGNALGVLVGGAVGAGVAAARCRRRRKGRMTPDALGHSGRAAGVAQRASSEGSRVSSS